MRHPPRSVLLAVAGTAAPVAGVLSPVVTAQGAAPACPGEYSVTGQWDTGFQGAVRITDNAAAMSGRSLAFDFTGGQNVTQGWNAKWSDDLGQWLARKPTDPTGSLAAAYHVHNFNSCADESCWTSTLAPVAAQVPLGAGEIGENTCSHGFVDRVMKWFDDRGLSYPGWTWNAWDCSTGPSLISAYDGTPTAYGIGMRDHLRALDG
jgi:hypothetical protein